MTKNIKRQESIIRELKNCLQIYVKKQQQARIYHELAVFTKDPDYKQQAIESWEEVYAQTPEYRFKIYISHLDKV